MQFHGGPLRGLIGLTRSLIFNQHTRRMAMFYSALGAMLMVLCGDMLLAEWLRERLQRFAVYWLVCAWLTMLSALLAIYDLVLIRVQHRAEQRRLRKAILPTEIDPPGR